MRISSSPARTSTNFGAGVEIDRPGDLRHRLQRPRRILSACWRSCSASSPCSWRNLPPRYDRARVRRDALERARGGDDRHQRRALEADRVRSELRSSRASAAVCTPSAIGRATAARSTCSSASSGWRSSSRGASGRSWARSWPGSSTSWSSPPRTAQLHPRDHRVFVRDGAARPDSPRRRICAPCWAVLAAVAVVRGRASSRSSCCCDRRRRIATDSARSRATCRRCCSGSAPCSSPASRAACCSTS